MLPELILIDQNYLALLRIMEQVTTRTLIKAKASIYNLVQALWPQLDQMPTMVALTAKIAHKVLLKRT